ncbi:MAG: peroxide stress protein YaaA [Kineosporiaceae bacterium]|nr:peroxide stress protein YaaA [Kineosporiaceae bacterium]
MLILLPPSEGKAAPARRGRPVELASLSFPELTTARAAMLERLATISARDDALAVLGVGASLAEEVQRNTRLSEVPARAASTLYTGVLYAALDWASLPVGAKRRAASRLLVISALWGALRPADAVPPYRLSMNVRMPGLGPLHTAWQPHLGPVLDAVAANSGVILDCRSEAYAKAWTPRGEAAERTAAVRVWRDGPQGRTVVSHLAKHTRGLIARDILVHGIEARTVPDLAAALGERWDVEPVAPTRPGRGWSLDVLAH